MRSVARKWTFQVESSAAARAPQCRPHPALVVRGCWREYRLHRRAQRNHFIRIQIGVRSPPEQILYQLPYFRNSRRAPDQHDFINLRRLQASIFQRLLARTHGAVNDGLKQLLERLPRDFALITFPAGQLDIELHRRLR